MMSSATNVKKLRCCGHVLRNPTKVTFKLGRKFERKAEKFGLFLKIYMQIDRTDMKKTKWPVEARIVPTGVDNAAKLKKAKLQF